MKGGNESEGGASAAAVMVSVPDAHQDGAVGSKAATSTTALNRLDVSQLEAAMAAAGSDSDDDQVAVDTEGHGYRHRQRLGAIAGVLLLCVICAGVGAAIYLSSTSSQGVTLPKEFSGSFTTKDRVKPELTYSGRVHKTTDAAGRAVLEATISHVDPWTKERVEVTVLDQRVYMQYFNDSVSSTTPVRVACMPPNLVPPYGDLNVLFDRAVTVPATHLDAENTGVQQCIDAGQRWVIRWGTQEFVYCRPHNDIHAVVGDNFATTFVADDVTTPIAATIPTDVATSAPMECDAVPDVSALTHDLSHTHSVSVARRMVQAPEHRRHLGTVRPCLFVGGSGQIANTLTQEPGDYWGPYIKTHLSSQCSSFWFMNRNMKSTGWDHTDHTDTLCSTALSKASWKSGNTIGKLRIFSHGAGSLVVAAALARHSCSFSSSTKWFSAMGPFGGAKAADEASNLCSKHSAMSGILNELQMCQGNNMASVTTGTIAQQTTYNGDLPLSQVLDYARNNVDGAMCGHDSSGLFEGVGVGLYSMDEEIFFGEDRDGFLGLSQCKTLRTGSWSDHNTNRWANIHINYLDGTCRFGDAYSDPYNDHSPCTWYAQRATKD